MQTYLFSFKFPPSNFHLKTSILTATKSDEKSENLRLLYLWNVLVRKEGNAKYQRGTKQNDLSLKTVNK